MSIAFHEVVADAGCFGEAVDILFVLDRVYFLVPLIGPLLGLRELIAVGGDAANWRPFVESFVRSQLLLLLSFAADFRLTLHPTIRTIR